MWISLSIGKRVMLAMACNPFLGDDRGGEPQPQSHRQRCEIMQLYTAVGLSTMQKQRHTNIGQMTGDDDEKNRLPPVRRPASKIRHFTSTPLVSVQPSLPRNLPGPASARYQGTTAKNAPDFSGTHAVMHLRLHPVMSSVSLRDDAQNSRKTQRRFTIAPANFRRSFSIRHASFRRSFRERVCA